MIYGEYLIRECRYSMNAGPDGNGNTLACSVDGCFFLRGVVVKVE